MFSGLSRKVVVTDFFSGACSSNGVGESTGHYGARSMNGFVAIQVLVLFFNGSSPPSFKNPNQVPNAGSCTTLPREIIEVGTLLQLSLSISLSLFRPSFANDTRPVPPPPAPNPRIPSSARPFHCSVEAEQITPPPAQSLRVVRGRREGQAPRGTTNVRSELGQPRRDAQQP